LKGNIQAHPEADETFPSSKSQQRAVLQSLLASNDPLITQALSDPDNIAFIKGVFGLDELAVPGEDSREKQLREISQLLAAAPIVIPVAPPPAMNAAPSAAQDPNAQGNYSAKHSQPYAASAANGDNTPGDSPVRNASNSAAPPLAASVGAPASAPPSPEARASGHTAQAQHFIELPSVPIDELLDDHAAELAEVRRWASSDAGQIARAQNPLGFANVRAHAAAHQSALARQSAQAAIQQAANASLTNRRK
jgi:hypothetical protein